MIQNITPQQAQQLVAAGQLDVIDVREPSEWAKVRIPGARLVPLGQFRANPTAFLRQGTVLFVCAAGVRSLTAAKVAEALGWKSLLNLSGGTRAWESAGLPVLRDVDAAPVVSAPVAAAVGLHP